MYRRPIANLANPPLAYQPVPREAFALADLGTFDTPIVSVWEVRNQAHELVGHLIQYSHVPARWSDPLVKTEYRRTHPDHLEIAIPRECIWVRIRPGYMPSFARSLDEAQMLMAVDYQRSVARNQVPQEPMNDPS